MSETPRICYLCDAVKNKPEGTEPIKLIDGMCVWCSKAWNLGYKVALDTVYELADKLTRISELHKPHTYPNGEVVCLICKEDGDYPEPLPYPCPTIQALRGEQ